MHRTPLHRVGPPSSWPFPAISVGRSPRFWGRVLGAGALLLALIGLALAGPSAWAGPSPQVIQPPTPATMPIDVVVLLDDSGSMATCWPWPKEGLPFAPPCRAPSWNEPSDPQELRYSAARLLVQLLGEEDRIAVIRFDSTAEGVGPLGTLQTAGTVDNRRRLAAALQPPTNYLPRGYTRLDLGLAETLQLLETTQEPGRNRFVLLLTDGEPTTPGNPVAQRQQILEQVETLRRRGVLLFPVILCNPSSGCPGQFLQDALVGVPLWQAESAQDLLLLFSQLLAQMKPDRSVVTSRNANGYLAFQTREAHGVRSLLLVSPRGALNAVRRDTTPVVTQSVLDDPNLELHRVAEPQAAGNWVAETLDPSAFAVVQTDSYPELLFPPPSALNSQASTRYYPAGRPPLLIARGVGPAASEPVLLNGQTPLPLWVQEPVHGRLVGQPLPVTDGTVVLQLGEDPAPLQLRRTFRLEARPDLPQAQVIAPTRDNPGLLEDGRLHLEVAFGPGPPLQALMAQVFVMDVTESADVSGPTVYQAQMACVERTCVDEGFTPQDGRSYRILYMMVGLVDGLRFGDWAEARLDMEPAVFLQGLPPAPLDLARIPLEGWPVTVVAGTNEPIGTLSGELELRRADTGEPVREVALDFRLEVPEEGSTTGYLRVEGLDRLRPGQYTGELRLTATSPAGRPMQVKIRPAPVLPVVLEVERSVARLETQVVEFPPVQFRTSPDFRVEVEAQIPLRFAPGKPFRLTAELVESTCPQLVVTTGQQVPRDDGYLLPVRLGSQQPVPPGICQGTLAFRPPTPDFDILPGTLPFVLAIRGIQWEIVGPSLLDVGDLRGAGERTTVPLEMRFEGTPPFVVQVEEIRLTGETPDGTVVLGPESIEVPPVTVTEPASEDHLYRVPITLVARRTLPNDPLRGTVYTGELVLAIQGLPEETRTLPVTLRSPTLYQRYVEWWLAPIYSLPWVLCTGPLTLLLLLILVARWRTRGFQEEEPVVTLPTPEILPGPEPDPTTALAGPEEIPSGVWDTPWSEGVWREGPSPGGPALPTPEETGEDPWSSRWS